MKKIFGFLVVGSCLLTTPVVAEDPLVASMDYCLNDPERDEPGEWGGGANESSRTLRMPIVYWRRDMANTVEFEIGNTRTVELCEAKVIDEVLQESEMVCPWTDSGDADWLVFDVVAKPDDFPPTADIVANAVKGPGVVVADVGGKSFLFRSKALYGDQDAEGKYLYLKVTDTDGNEMPITGWKSCPVPYLLDESSGVFQMFGALGYYTDPVGKTGFMPFTDPWFGEGPTNVCQRIASNGHTHPSCVIEEAAAWRHRTVQSSKQCRWPRAS